MPIRAEMRDRYPVDWELRRRFVLMRAGHRCEFCRVHNYAVGWRDGETFRYVCGNQYLDSLAYTASHKAARELADHANGCRDPDMPRLIVIVLTIAHIHDHRPEAASLLNLAALCQRCHNRHDVALRRENRQRSRHQGQLGLLVDECGGR